MKGLYKVIFFSIGAAMVLQVLRSAGFPIEKTVNYLAEFFMKVMG